MNRRGSAVNTGHEKHAMSSEIKRALLLFLLLITHCSWLSLPAQAAAPIVLPIEIMGPEGTIKSVTFNLPTGTSGSVDHLFLQVHSGGYIASYQAAHNLSDKASVQINGGAWIDLDNNTVALYPHDLAAGGFGGGFSTVRGTMPTAPWTLHDGDNTISFRFNKTDGISAGFRVINFNLQSLGHNVLDPSAFINDDPATWTAPAGANAGTGQTLWQTASLIESPLPGAPHILAKCMDCHARTGGDLKYFNFSNYSIQARAMFHGLSAQDGANIAAYIRGLSFYQSKNGRPWNPPYQPGPGMDSVPIQEWAAGAGLGAVLDNDRDMMPYLFSGGIKDNGVVNPRGELNTREVPIEIQLLDWNRWLPRIHPMDVPAPNNNWNSSGVQAAYQNLRSALQSAGAITPASFVARGFQYQFQTFFDAVIAMVGNTTPPTWTDQRATEVYSGRRWDMVKNWELMEEFQLEQVGNAFNSHVAAKYAESRGWFQSQAFDASPFINHINPPGDDGTPDHSHLLKDYDSHMWYQLEFTLNNFRWNGDNRPVDWGYNPGVFDAFQRETFPQPFRWFYFLIRGGQVSTNDYGPEESPFGWEPQAKMEVSFLAHFFDSLSFVLGNQMSQSEWVAATTVMLQNWLARNKEYRPDEYYTSIDYFGPSIPNPNYVVTGQNQTGEIADIWWKMIPKFRADGISETLIGQMLDWFKTVYPKTNWDLLRNTSITTPPSLIFNVNPTSAGAPATIAMSATLDTRYNQIALAKVEFWVNDLIKIGETSTPDNNGLYNFSWTNVQAGNYNVAARLILPDGSTLMNSANTQVTVSGGGGPSAPTITSFSASPATINAGQSTTISWTTSGATAVQLVPVVGNQLTSGSVSVSPSLTTVYTLTAASIGGTTTQQKTVTVQGSLPSPPTLAPTPTTLNFAATASGSNPNTQTVTVNNSGSGSLSWTVSSNVAWLTASPTTGSDGAVVTASVNVSGLAANTYSGTLSFQDSSASNTPQTVFVNLTVNAALSAPTITQQPVDVTVSAGQNALFTITASGNPAPIYQWQSKAPGAGSFTNVSGATAASLTLNSVALSADLTQVQCVVSNSQGSVTSTPPAALHVNPNPVVITAQPQNTSVVAGQTASFSVTASGSAPLSCQWQSKAPGGSFVNVAGGTSANYTTPITALSDDGTQFKCIVSNGAGSVPSNAATLTVTSSVIPPTIQNQPQPVSITVGQTATFTVGASGSAPLSYQWQKSTGGAFTNIIGANSSSYTTPVAVIGDNGSRYQCVVNNSANAPVTSTPATLTVTNPIIPPSITSQPQNKSVVVGQTATFTVGASGSVPLSYQWQYALPGNNSFVNLAGQNTAAYTTPITTLSYDGYRYQCVVNNSANAPATSLPATLSVTTSSSSGGGPTPLQDLDLSSWPGFEPVDGTLNVGYSGDLSSISFTWTIVRKSGSPYGSGAEGVAGMLSRASTANFTVQHSNSAGLASLNLSPGAYTITVQAFDTSGNSSKAVSKDVTLMYSNLQAVRIFPNPWRKDKHAGKPMTFDHLAYGSTVKIFTVSGHVVKTLTPSNDSVTWDITNDSGDKVASGIYIYLITTGDSGYGGNGQRAKGKIGVVR
jgi:hypothetical protein